MNVYSFRSPGLESWSLTVTPMVNGCETNVGSMMRKLKVPKASLSAVINKRYVPASVSE